MMSDINELNAAMDRVALIQTLMLVSLDKETLDRIKSAALEISKEFENFGGSPQELKAISDVQTTLNMVQLANAET